MSPGLEGVSECTLVLVFAWGQGAHSEGNAKATPPLLLLLQKKAIAWKQMPEWCFEFLEGTRHWDAGPWSQDSEHLEQRCRDKVESGRKGRRQETVKKKGIPVKEKSLCWEKMDRQSSSLWYKSANAMRQSADRCHRVAERLLGVENKYYIKRDRSHLSLRKTWKVVKLRNIDTYGRRCMSAQRESCAKVNSVQSIAPCPSVTPPS